MDLIQKTEDFTMFDDDYYVEKIAKEIENDFLFLTQEQFYKEFENRVKNKAPSLLKTKNFKQVRLKYTIHKTINKGELTDGRTKN